MVYMNLPQAGMHREGPSKDKALVSEPRTFKLWGTLAVSVMIVAVLVLDALFQLAKA
jgi:hypothetical protein